MTGFMSRQISAALGPALPGDIDVTETGRASLPSWFAVSELATASLGAAAAELGAFQGACRTTLDHYLALKWFDMTLRPTGWALPSLWDAIAGDYQAADGWIRLHTNADHHRAAALSVLGCPADRTSVQKAVAGWQKESLEEAVVSAGGVAAAMHSLEDWARHRQGQAVQHEPLIAWRQTGQSKRTEPLAGLRVLDLTRILAGPVATRFLAGFGAQVLRIDPPGWHEPAVEPEVTLGKRRAGLDLRQIADRQVFESLMQRADVLIHGYRPGALAALGYDAETVQRHAPALIEVTLNAYGWTGPWAGRRGFDSLVQMSSGIAHEGMRRSDSHRPVPLPVQALDHATGYLIAAAVLRALRHRQASGQVLSARLSLARTAALLISAGCQTPLQSMRAETEAELDPLPEATGWGPARRLRFPVALDGHGPQWRYPAGPLRLHAAIW